MVRQVSTTRIGIISDTHIPGRASALPPGVFGAFDGVEVILHAGDLVTGGVLEELGALARVHAVLGNMDESKLQGRLPMRLRLDLAGIAVGMIHDSGSSRGRRERMRREFPGCRVVVCGHTHQPEIDDDGELMLLNPGSACAPWTGQQPTVAILRIEDGVPRAELLKLRPSAAGVP